MASKMYFNTKHSTSEKKKQIGGKKRKMSNKVRKRDEVSAGEEKNIY